VDGFTSPSSAINRSHGLEGFATVSVELSVHTATVTQARAVWTQLYKVRPLQSAKTTLAIGLLLKCELKIKKKTRQQKAYSKSTDDYSLNGRPRNGKVGRVDKICAAWGPFVVPKNLLITHTEKGTQIFIVNAALIMRV
jgi:hypothetical protein